MKYLHLVTLAELNSACLCGLEETAEGARIGKNPQIKFAIVEKHILRVNLDSDPQSEHRFRTCHIFTNCKTLN